MVRIKFFAKSLLYGYSYMWSIFQITFPLRHYPHFSKTKNEHIFTRPLLRIRSFESGRKLEDFLIKHKKSIRFPMLVLRYLGIIINLINIAFFLPVIASSQKKLLTSYNVSRESELSYKVIYYTPFIHVSIPELKMGWSNSQLHLTDASIISSQ